MEVADRKHLYMTLLRGLAQQAQDQLCADGSGHDWSPWHRTALQPDIPLGPAMSGPVFDSGAYRVRADRRCLNCGKEEMARDA